MTQAEKLEWLKALSGGSMQVGQLIIENSGTITYNDNRGDSRQEHGSAASDTRGKEAIMEYLGRLKPVVRDEYRDSYDSFWEGILELDQVKAVIYNKGKQQDTTFNRNLLAQIIHQVEVLYVPTANTVKMALCLEPDKGADHPVRQKLGEVPDKPIKKAIEAYVSEHL